MIAPAGHHHGKQAEHQDRDAPAQRDRIENIAAPAASRMVRGQRARPSGNLAPVAAARTRDVKGVLANESMIRSVTAAIRGS